MDKVVGFTTTIPVEILFAADVIPCDLNNIFISAEEPMFYIERAERDGFPRNMCNWVKGIYGVVMEKGIEEIVAVVEGDCSNTQALMEILKHRGKKVIPFSFPYDRDRDVLKRELKKLASYFSVTPERIKKVEKEIEDVRRLLEEIDRLTWQERLVTGYENHLWLVRSSDMMGDYKKYGGMAERFIAEVKTRKKNDAIPIGMIGVPPIQPDLFEFIEKKGVHVVFNETQRQFSLPYFSKRMAERYTLYTYPYGIFYRVKDILGEIKRRNLKGIVHYVQAFCYRSMEDVILRETIPVPFLTIEGDLPKGLDSRTKIRLEAYVEMLIQKEGV
ncbi:MAG: 2-hydroxyacyl-CoA dehydratase [Syntrophorhabdaceae bacterium]|nr:2-hydroxyacyl-CoA dehydratase [Syntrophorhabdaceae bacterium]